MKYELHLKNDIQKALYERELEGQFSDGLWENSRTQDWKTWTSVDVIVDGELYTTVPEYKKHYNCANKELVDYVGGRMVSIARWAKHFGEEGIRFSEYFYCGKDDLDKKVTEDDWKHIVEQFEEYAKDSSNDYWENVVKEAKAIEEKFGVDKIVEAMNDESYGLKELRKDLREITTAMKVRK
jgi:adenosine deaminase